ncbi:MAG: TonB family protein, partial [Thermoanaerobaculia bacterium]
EILGKNGELTSNDIFGELLEEEKPTARKTMKPTDDIDKLLEQTLSGMMPRRKDPNAAATSPGTIPIPKTTIPAGAKPGSSELDKLVSDTLSGLEKKPRLKTVPPATVPAPAPAPPAPGPAPIVDNVLLSQPVVATPPKEEEKEEEPTDGIRYGQYVLLEKIATGGMAEVWKARMRGMEGFQKIVAIKKILPHLSDNQDFIEMFIDEAKLAAQLNHNNIIHIYDLGKTQGTYFIAMEYVDGHDLKSILKRGTDRDQPLGVELSLFIASKVAAALDYAHRRRDFEEKEMSLVHRDVSPQNMLISQEGDIKLCDFGIAKAASKASHTQAGALKGKLQYMSPEQAWGKPIDRRSDIFALATVLFEMLTGRKLFTGENEISILEQVREARVVPPSQFNDEATPEIDKIVLKALHREPSERYQTAGEMARDIDSVLYNMKPTPTSADLAIYMHRIWVEEAPHLAAAATLVDQPLPATVIVPIGAPAAAAPAPAARAGAPAPAVAPAAAAAVPMPPWEAPKQKPVVPIAIAAAVVVVLGIGGLFLLRSRGGATASASQPKAQPAVGAATTPMPVTPAPTDSVATQTLVPEPATALPVATQTAPAIDQAQVDAEVQKRIAAERARLEEQARAVQQAQNTPPPPQQRPAPVLGSSQPPVQQPPAPQPAPVTQTVAPPAPAPAVATTMTETATPPQETATVAAPQRAREGDLVPAGTEGLTPAHITRQAVATYPPIARMQRVAGSVTLNVLVSETGQVLETRVISGTTRFGFEEAAQQAVRRSTFAPGTKDGVRVKSWTTVRIDFKL